MKAQTPYDPNRILGCGEAIKEIMLPGGWWTLSQIRLEIHSKHHVYAAEAGISARVRDFRKKEWGSYVVDKERIAKGLWRYRLLPPRSDPQMRML